MALQLDTLFRAAPNALLGYTAVTFRSDSSRSFKARAPLYEVPGGTGSSL